MRWKELVGGDKGSFIKKKQRLHVKAKENERFILYLLSAGDVELGMASECRAVALEDKRLHNQCPPPLSLAFIAEQSYCWVCYRISLWSFGSAVLVMYPPKPLPTPSLLAFGGKGLEDSLGVRPTLWQEHWCVVNIILATNTKHSTIGAAMGKVNSILTRNKYISCAWHSSELVWGVYFE